VLNFNFYAPTRIVFGKETQHEIGSLLKPLAKKVLLHYGGSSAKNSGLYDQIAESLRNNGVDFAELGGVKPNPRLSLVKEGIALCKREDVGLILAVGGGSAIDSAKAIAMGVYYDGDVWDIYERRLPVKKALPVATVLTIPAAGSEMSGASVITNEEKQMKLGYAADSLRPVLSVVNPELFSTLPENQISNGVADMMSHIFERYFTNTTAVELTDELCEAALRAIMKNALIVVNDPSNYQAWCEVGFGGTIAHNDLLGVGREQDWACHGMEHELSAIYDVPHGAGLAVLTPNWMEYVYNENAPMFAQFAVNVMGVKGSYREMDAVIREGIARLREFFRKMKLPATLSELGIGDDKLELMAKKATKVEYGIDERPLGGLKKLKWQDVLAIYKLAK
jgi:alcohol dehydrogenase YqhD (iron-dependent ADH family)